jgi:hypothetical protein
MKVCCVTSPSDYKMMAISASLLIQGFCQAVWERWSIMVLRPQYLPSQISEPHVVVVDNHLSGLSAVYADRRIRIRYVWDTDTLLIRFGYFSSRIKKVGYVLTWIHVSDTFSQLN